MGCIYFRNGAARMKQNTLNKKESSIKSHNKLRHELRELLVTKRGSYCLLTPENNEETKSRKQRASLSCRKTFLFRLQVNFEGTFLFYPLIWDGIIANLPSKLYPNYASVNACRPELPFSSTTTLVVRSLYSLPSIIKTHISTPDFLTATPMALLASFKKITPPESIVNGPPTPPLTTDAKFSRHVATILRVFKGCKNGYPPSGPWTVYKLNSGEYEGLQRRLKDDVELWEYVNDKVR